MRQDTTRAARKQVFRPFLDNPYTKNAWPAISPESISAITDVLVSVLQPIGTFNGLKKKKVTPPPQEPFCYKSVAIGFNSVNSAVEDQIQRAVHDSSDKDTTKDPIIAVFICKSDISNPVLTNHFPLLCATASKLGDGAVKLIQLPHGSKSKLSGVLDCDGSYIALRASLAETMPAYMQTLTNLLDNAPPVSIEWLNKNPVFQKANIRRLQTTAPIIKKKEKHPAKK